MGIYYGISAGNTSSIFKSLNQSSNNSFTFGVYGSLGDYGLIKNGGYAKLCKAYYAKEESTSSESDKKTEESDKLTANYAVDFKKDANVLSKMDFSESNKKKVTSGVKDFVDSYNNMISSASNSSASNVSNTVKHLTNYAKVNERLLKQVGITIESDNKLSVNTDTLEKADMSNLKNVFQGSSSFSGRASTFASSIYKNAVFDSSSLYSSAGTISALNMSSLYDTYL